MNGMLLAAGLGERMEPLSTWVPKAALEVLGRPLLASALDHLLRAGCATIVANLHRHPEPVAAAVREAAGDAAAPRFSLEPELLGSAGGVAAARTLLGPGDLVVANADVWAELDLTPLLAQASPGEAVLALLPHPDPRRWSSVVLDAEGRVERFLPPGEGDPGTAFLFTGFQVLGREVVAGLPPPPGPMSVVWESLRRHGALRGVGVSGSWREAGTPAAYRDLVVSLLRGRWWVHPRARVEGGASLEESAVGAGCRVAAGSSLLASVLTAGARVGRGCELVRCVVAGPVDLADGSELADQVITPAARISLV